MKLRMLVVCCKIEVVYLVRMLLDHDLINGNILVQCLALPGHAESRNSTLSALGSPVPAMPFKLWLNA